MREGPLADLFRSTVEGDSAEPETDTSEQTRALPADPGKRDERREPPARRREAEAPGPPDPEEVTVYRLEDEQGQVEDPPAPRSRERLRDILIEGDDRGAVPQGHEDPHPSGSYASSGVPITPTPLSLTHAMRSSSVSPSGWNCGAAAVFWR